MEATTAGGLQCAEVRRREFLSLPPALYFLPRPIPGQLAAGPEAIGEPHFPSRLYLFVWRNWELANTERMAKVIRTAPETILELGASMGLPAKPRLSDDQLARIYITVIRQNWHVLPEEQIIDLLGWNRQKFEFTLKEDDFLAGKLGLKKPRCGKLVYAPPAAAERARAAEIRATVRELFGDAIHQPGEELCHFVKSLSDPAFRPLRDRAARAGHDEVDLSQGWSLAAAPELSAEADRFRSWLREAMQAGLQSGGGTKHIRLALDPAGLSGYESYRVEVAPDRIAITGHDRGAFCRRSAVFRTRWSSRRRPFCAYRTCAKRQPGTRATYIRTSRFMATR
jgi:hypothetical protein